MWYDCGDGTRQWITREDARRIDREQNRHKLHSDELEALTDLNAGYNMWRAHAETLQKHAEYCKQWKTMLFAMKLIHRCLQGLAKKVNVEQICALQHNTHNVYVVVKSYPEQDQCCIPHNDLAQLVECARGGLHDEKFEYHRCSDCMACMNRAEWQNCDLYHLLLRMPCNIKEEDRIDESVCPYALMGENHE